MLSVSILSCQKESLDTFDSFEDNVFINRKVDTSYFDFIYTELEESDDLTSSLKKKTKNLSDEQIESKVIKIGKVKKQSSIFYKAILEKPEFCYNRFNCIKVRDLNQFEKAIDAIFYVQMEFSKMSHLNDTLKLGIEEIIFHKEEDARQIINYVQRVREFEYFWNTLDKSGSYLFRESNKIYFVRTRNVSYSIYPEYIAKMTKKKYY